MSLNIKNERTHALIRELAALTGKNQTQAVEDAVRRALEEQKTQSLRPDMQWERGISVIEAFHRTLTEEDREALRGAEDELYDEDGLPV